MNDALLHISGGMDSTFVMWQYLRLNPGASLVVHHVNLQHLSEDRLYHEREAVANILKWFIKNDFTFRYYESTFLYGTLPRIKIKDIQIVSMFTAIIQKTGNLAAKKLLLSWHKGEVHELGEKGKRIRLMLEALECPVPEFEFPIERLTRKDMAAQMPKDLLELCWVCRTPDNGKPCRKCKTCIEMIEAGIY